MNSIITVLGHDKVGIIAAVCNYLAESNINILDISQTILQGYFNMIMIVDMKKCSTSFVKVADDLNAIGEKIGVSIRIQNEDIFNSMHRI